MGRASRVSDLLRLQSVPSISDLLLFYSALLFPTRLSWAPFVRCTEPGPGRVCCVQPHHPSSESGTELVVVGTAVGGLYTQDWFPLA